jgi:hypothetical protein
MKRFMKKLETTMVAAAYAEAGEFDTARQFLNEEEQRTSNRPSAKNEQRPVKRAQLRAD